MGFSDQGFAVAKDDTLKLATAQILEHNEESKAWSFMRNSWFTSVVLSLSHVVSPNPPYINTAVCYIVFLRGGQRSSTAD
jgi:hypothetical protein